MDDVDGHGEGYPIEPEPPAPPTRRTIIIGPHARHLISHDALRERDVPCLNCGYNLRGLVPEGSCPECGALIVRSLQGNLLQFSNPAYLASLHRGVVLVLCAALAHATITPVAIGSAFAFAFTPPALLLVGMTTVSLVSSLLSLAGWWMFTTPDPGIMDGDKGDRPRQIARACVAMQAVTTLAMAAIEHIPFGVGVQPLVNVVMVFGGALTIAGFFASMYYIRWLAPRVPDKSLRDTAARYLWLLPLIAVLGACVLLGPLIASILYLLVLNQVRIALRDIRRRQGHGRLTNVIA
jgi:hypothetical protein